jgi:segregation and condensation protein A
LLARLLDHLRHRGAGAWLSEREQDLQGWIRRAVPPPAGLRRAPAAEARAALAPELLGAALGGLLRTPAPIDLRHMADPRVALSERLGVLRGLLRRGRFSFEEAVRGGDRMTVAVTVFALLELYKSGEARWEQAEPFGPVTVLAAAGTRSAEGVA